MNAFYLAAHDVALLAQGSQSGPVGPEFGKASPSFLQAGIFTAAIRASVVEPCLRRITASIRSMMRRSIRQ